MIDCRQLIIGIADCTSATTRGKWPRINHRRRREGDDYSQKGRETRSSWASITSIVLQVAPNASLQYIYKGHDLTAATKASWYILINQNRHAIPHPQPHIFSRTDRKDISTRIGKVCMYICTYYTTGTCVFPRQ